MRTEELTTNSKAESAAAPPHRQPKGLCLSFGEKDTEGHVKCCENESNLFLRLPVPVLGGPQEEFIHNSTAGYLRESGSWSIVDSGSGEICGVTSIPFFGEQEREEIVRELYLQLTSLLDGRKIYRMWNFVPQINELRDDLENYRAFNIGRWKAFEESGYLDCAGCSHPAASAVGSPDSSLSIAFCAGFGDVEYFENPSQVPAWRYPSDYGPKSPCFVRGTVVDGSQVYLSGTASILGHESKESTSLQGQFETTLQNVDCMLEKMGANRRQSDALFRIYVRHREDFDEIRNLWQEAVDPVQFDNTCFLLADICRQELLLEVEGRFRI